MRYRTWSLLAVICLGISLTLSAGAAKPAPTVERVYLGLSSGALRHARLVTLPNGMVLRAGTVTITEQQVTAEIARGKADLQPELRKNRFFVLEQLATKTLLLAEARVWAKETGWAGNATDDRAVVNAYLRSVAAGISVTDEEVRAYYAANKELMGGAAFDTIAKELQQYVLDEKRQQAIDRHVQSISTRMTVEVQTKWVAAQAKTALQNPVDRARRAGKPAMIEFGAEGCRACDMMAPILRGLQEAYSRQCTVFLCQVREEPILAARYGITSIPVQVFFDKDGREVFRHVGYFPKAQVVEQLKKLGVR